MATADEILENELTAEDTWFEIDLTSRQIIIPKSVTNLGAKSDADVVRVKFRLPRFYYDVDFADFKMGIDYTNAKGEEDRYEPDDLTVEDDVVTFTWTIGRHAALYNGTVTFGLCAKRPNPDDPGDPLSEFHTTKASLPILDSMETCEEAVLEYTDILEQWRAKLFGNSTEVGEFAAAFGEETKAPGKAAFAAGTKITRSGGDENVPGDWRYTEAIGDGSMAFGMGAVAYSRASKSLGYRTQTGYPPSQEELDKRPEAITKKDTNGNDIFPADNEGQGAVSIGSDTLAAGNNSFAGGLDAQALAQLAFVFGSATIARAKGAIALGSHTEADGDLAVALGSGSKAKNHWSFAANSGTIAQGNCAAVFGDHTATASQWNDDGSNRSGSPGYAQLVAGRYNAYANGEIDTALFALGNGSSDDKRSNAFIVTKYGNAQAMYHTVMGADYAEMFEWADGNPEAEDRIGYVVALVGEKIRLAQPGDDILGVISGTAALVGDSASLNWKDKYMTDEFGRILYDMVEEFEDIEDPETHEITQVSLGFFPHPRINPEYDPASVYIPREERTEWSKVGMLGKLYVRDDGSCVAGGYCAVGADGTLTHSENPTNIRVMKRTSENIVWVLLK